MYLPCNSSRCQNLSKAEQAGELQVFIPTNIQEGKAFGHSLFAHLFLPLTMPKTMS